MSGRAKETLEIAGRAVAITNGDRVVFPATGYTKRDLVYYYMVVADGALRGVAGRPLNLKRFVDGVGGEAFFQKRAPATRPDWIETVEFTFPSGRSADEVVVRDAAQLAWMVNLGCVDLNPHPVRAEDLDHPDELRIDLDPVPGVPWADVREVALLSREVLAEHGLVGWPKTSGSRGIHVYARIARRWRFDEVRHAALAVAREVERRAPALATSAWWKEERHGVFLDYNQNARDRTMASAWSVRPTPDARVSMPLRWEEVRDVDAAAFTLVTAPDRFRAIGDPWAGMDATEGSLDRLLELSEGQLAERGEAPLPPHAPRAPGEPPRVQPSRRRQHAPRTRLPVVTVARARTKEEAMAALERWRARHPEVTRHLAERDVLVDAMRGRYKTWTRIRVNLEHVPEADRPPPEPLEVDYDPWGGADPRSRRS